MKHTIAHNIFVIPDYTMPIQENDNTDYLLSSLYNNSDFPFSFSSVKGISRVKPSALLTSLVQGGE
ncbi:unnamed protein product [Fusarium graminearum]|nr:unnamed protein product [Fusarium graminearum]